MIEIAHQRRAGLAAGDVARGTAHVDVDDVSAGSFRDPRAFGHPVRFAAGELNDVGPYSGRLAAQTRHRPAINQIIAGGHLGNDQTRAKRSRQPSKRRVGNPRHRRQQNPVGDLDIANL